VVALWRGRKLDSGRHCYHAKHFVALDTALFLGLEETRLKMDQAYWSSVGEVSICYSVIFRSILGVSISVGDSLNQKNSGPNLDDVLL
jgi:hypothetical protein